MPLTIDKENFSIKTRSGDSISLTLRFNLPLNDYCVDFCVTKDLDTKTIPPVIQKCYRNIEGNLLRINLTSNETRLLKCDGNFPGRYFWGLRIHNDDGYAATIIPAKFNQRPKIFVYPKIGGCENE